LIRNGTRYKRAPAGGLTQSGLARKVGMTYIQIGRYEKRGAVPSSDVLKKLADALQTTTDYLMNGDKEEKAKAALKDSDLLQQFKALNELDEKDKGTIKDIIDAFIKRSKLKNIAVLQL
jgi:transcriptional regulator with XRE-family HTH domain